ncbi:MAG TPA: hypothetical protein VGA68_07960 [Woeseiaceae bacterium]|jgi:hypothetical protein
MPGEIFCYRCGASLAGLSLPLSRQDECPVCENYLHVCRMCIYFDRHVPRQCREDGAEEVLEKERPNFCDWFKPSASAFDIQSAGQAEQAKSALSALFGDSDAAGPADDDALKKARDLFK